MKTNTVITKLVAGLVIALLLTAPALTWADEDQGDSERYYLGVQLSS